MSDWTGAEQSKGEWLKWRGKGLGSSDAPIIMGVSPWKTPYQLWLEKTNIKPSTFKGNWATRRGQELEPQIRIWYIGEHGIKMTPQNAEHHENPVWRASADGYNKTMNRLIEIKAPNIKDHQTAVEGNIPEKYFPQCQWLLMVFNAESLDYVSFNESHETSHAVVEIKPDLDYIRKLKEAASDFWNHVERQIPPPTDEQIIDEQSDTAMAIAKYKALKEERDSIDTRIKQVVETIKEGVTSSKAICGDTKLNWVNRKGSIDYAKIPELKKLDLEAYRKQPTKYFTIR